MKVLKVFLIIVAVVCIGVAVSYPIRYKIELDSNNSELEDLSNMRRRVMEEMDIDSETDSPAAPEAEAPAETVVTQVPAEETPTETVTQEHTEQTPVETVTQAPTEETPAETVTQAPAEETPAETVTQAPAEETPAETVTQAPTEETPAETVTQAPAEQTPAEIVTQKPAEQTPAEASQPATPPPVTPTPGIMDLLLDDAFLSTRTPPATSTPKPSPSPTPSPTPNRSVRGEDEADTFRDKQKVRLDVNSILPELREIYELNHDLVGWLYIEDTNIDYPVVQCDDGKWYLTHDFYGKSNANGQIILMDKCDPYTPSYNLVISGHHMNSGAMFGRLGLYKDKNYWETHKIVEFDTLMARKRYVVFGAFYSADYDEHEDGFRYSADVQYKLECDKWLGEIRDNQVYETDIEVEFGDEFITLTTCDHSKRYDGRFVVVARRIREGEKF